MRPPGGALLLAICYGAGLVTGLSRFPDPLSVAVTAIGIAVVLRRPVTIALTAALVVGIGVGSQTRTASRAHCAARLPTAESRLTLRLIESGIDAGRVTVLDPACVGTLSARWPRGTAIAAGRDVTVTARWIPRDGALGRPGGTLVIRRVLAVAGEVSLSSRLRTWLDVLIVERFGSRAALVSALVTGRRGGLDPALREAFVGAGLIHLLAISGFHVGLLAGWLLLVLRLGGAPRHVAEVAAAVAAVGYAGWLGWPAPATRAASLLLVLAVARSHQRHPRFDAVLGASALVVLVRSPWSVVDLGAWLSFAAVAGVGWALGWSDRAVGSHVVVRGLAASIGATLATAPVAALTLGRVATIGVGLNLVAIPLVAAAMPAVLLALLLHAVAPESAGAFATSANLLLALLERIAIAGVGLPGASEVGTAGWRSAFPWMAALAAALWITHRRTTRREAARRLGWCAALLLWWPLAGAAIAWRPDPGRGGLALHLLDVGQGDAAVVRTPGGHWIVIDAGPSGNGFDAGARVVGPYLARLGVRRIEAFVLSHAHKDHVGGAAALATRFPIGVAIDPGEAFVEASYDAWLETLAERGVRWRRAAVGDHWTIDGVEFRVVHPPVRWDQRGFDLNEDSIVLELRYGAFVALLTGDAGFPAESLLGAAVGPVALLKVGHHGSRHSTGAPFLAAVAPQAAVISVGRNGYGHPAPATLGRLREAGVPLWRTDQHGTVRVETDGRSFTVRGGRAAQTFDLNRGVSRVAPLAGHHP